MLRGREVLRLEVIPREVGRGRVLVFGIEGGAGAFERDTKRERNRCFDIDGEMDVLILIS